VSLQGSYGRDETFCATGPERGRISYRVASDDATVGVSLAGLPASTTVSVDWLNDLVRGYTIGTFTTDTTGSSVPGTMHLFRPGETHGYEILLTSSDPQATAIGSLRPCG